MPTERDPLDLLGTWDLSREIIEHADDIHSSVEGTTSLTFGVDGRIRWHEEGTLVRAGHRSEVSRCLYVEQRDAGWFVTFEDGRDFHPWQTGEAVEHLCSPDRYVGTIRRLDPDRWSVQWRVTGPKKDYTMSSTLTRRTS